jgi:hypothetical protein
MNAIQIASAIDTINALDLGPVKTKLMHVASGEGWTAAYADSVEVEYRRFLTLMKLYPNESTAPVVDVDTFWHYHILDTAKYAVDCAAAFGYFLHHYPYLGLEGAEDEAARDGAGARMQELYAATFGAGVPAATAAEAAWCGATTAKPATAWCGATTGKQATAWCGSATAKPATAWCGATTGKQATAWCGSATAKPATAWCGATTGKQATAWCGTATAKPATAWCGATTVKQATAWCGATTGKKATAWCGSATAKPATAWCGATTAAPQVAWCGATTAVQVGADVVLTVKQAA